MLKGLKRLVKAYWKNSYQDDGGDLKRKVEETERVIERQSETLGEDNLLNSIPKMEDKF